MWTSFDKGKNDHLSGMLKKYSKNTYNHILILLLYVQCKHASTPVYRHKRIQAVNSDLTSTLFHLKNIRVIISD